MRGFTRRWPFSRKREEVTGAVAAPAEVFTSHPAIPGSTVAAEVRGEDWVSVVRSREEDQEHIRRLSEMIDSNRLRRTSSTASLFHSVRDLGTRLRSRSMLSLASLSRGSGTQYGQVHEACSAHDLSSGIDAGDTEEIIQECLSSSSHSTSSSSNDNTVTTALTPSTSSYPPILPPVLIGVPLAMDWEGVSAGSYREQATDRAHTPEQSRMGMLEIPITPVIEIYKHLDLHMSAQSSAVPVYQVPNRFSTIHNEGSDSNMTSARASRSEASSFARDLEQLSSLSLLPQTPKRKVQTSDPSQWSRGLDEIQTSTPRRWTVESESSLASPTSCHSGAFDLDDSLQEALRNETEGVRDPVPGRPFVVYKDPVSSDERPWRSHLAHPGLDTIVDQSVASSTTAITDDQ